MWSSGSGEESPWDERRGINSVGWMDGHNCKLLCKIAKKGYFGHDTYRPQPFYHTWLNHWFHMVSPVLWAVQSIWGGEGADFGVVKVHTYIFTASLI
jgi:hypothetical protein